MCEKCDDLERENQGLKDEIKGLKDELRWAKHDGFVMNDTVGVNRDVKYRDVKYGGDGMNREKIEGRFENEGFENEG